MVVSRLPDSSWRIGHDPEAVWMYDAQSSTAPNAIAAAKTAYYKQHGPQGRPLWPVVEPGGYVVPDELVPRSRKVAKLMGARFYVGISCAQHPLNHIRSVGNKNCVVCEILRQAGIIPA